MHFLLRHCHIREWYVIILHNIYDSRIYLSHIHLVKMLLELRSMIYVHTSHQ